MNQQNNLPCAVGSDNQSRFSVTRISVYLFFQVFILSAQLLRYSHKVMLEGSTVICLDLTFCITDAKGHLCIHFLFELEHLFRGKSPLFLLIWPVIENQ